jgi:segregation and condensation protein B
MDEIAHNPAYIAQAIEAILFHRSEAVSKKELAKVLMVTDTHIDAGLNALRESLHDRGIVLLEKDNKVLLGTAPIVATIVEKLLKEELHKELGKAGLDTLTVVLYAGPITRPDIDYIRGVNSAYILKHLLVRGLVERIADTRHNRFFYRPTFELMSYLGISDISELPEYSSVRQELLGYAEDSRNQDVENLTDEEEGQTTES